MENCFLGYLKDGEIEKERKKERKKERRKKGKRERYVESET